MFYVFISRQWKRMIYKEAVKLKLNISRSNNLSASGYGAFPHRPTKGFSERLQRRLAHRPLETFGRKFLDFFLKYQVYELDSPQISKVMNLFFRESRGVFAGDAAKDHVNAHRVCAVRTDIGAFARRDIVLIIRETEEGPLYTLLVWIPVQPEQE